MPPGPRGKLALAGVMLAIAGGIGAPTAASGLPMVREYSVAPSRPCTVAADPRTGNVYFSALLGPSSTSVGSIGVLDPATGSVGTIPLPSAIAAPGGMAFAPNGDLYVAEYLGGNAIVQLDPGTGSLTEFPLPTALSQPTSLVAGPDGGIWFIENGTQRLGRFDPVTHRFTEYALPTPGANLALEIIERGSGDNLLFSLPDTNQIGVFDIGTHRFTTYTSPTPGSLPQGVAEADGAIWFTETLFQQLVRIDPATGHITQYPLATLDPADPTLLAPFPGSMIAADDGDLYILDGTTSAGDSIIRFDPVTHVETVIRTPTVASGPCDWDSASLSTLWFGELSAGRIGRIDLVRPAPGTSSSTASAAATAHRRPG